MSARRPGMLSPIMRTCRPASFLRSSGTPKKSRASSLHQGSWVVKKCSSSCMPSCMDLPSFSAFWPRHLTMWKPISVACWRPNNMSSTLCSAPASIRSGLVITGMVRRVVGSTFLASAMISELWRSTLAGATARMTQRSFLRYSSMSALMSSPRVALSFLLVKRTMPGKSISVRSTHSGPNTSTSTMSRATDTSLVADLLPVRACSKMHCCARSISVGMSSHPSKCFCGYTFSSL
mmetsp:Transcript_27919/g.61092  ORF Transcript_27919/g.61092 Transcript_27919/m.61092 type:complete len:235 (-) Transcript_27919:604-1308(-)